MRAAPLLVEANDDLKSSAAQELQVKHWLPQPTLVIGLHVLACASLARSWLRCAPLLRAQKAGRCIWRQLRLHSGAELAACNLCRG